VSLFGGVIKESVPVKVRQYELDNLSLVTCNLSLYLGLFRGEAESRCFGIGLGAAQVSTGSGSDRVSQYYERISPLPLGEVGWGCESLSGTNRKPDLGFGMVSTCFNV
jgi:hypothetical protein